MTIPFPTAPQGRVIPITPLDEPGPCPRTQQEQMRRRLFPAYRDACMDVSEAKRAVYAAGLRRQQALLQPHRPLRFLQAVMDGVGARIELAFARRWQKNVAHGLDHARVNQALGWPADHVASCAHEARPVRWKSASIAFASVAALTLTPLRNDWLPLTPTQKLEMAIAGMNCVALTGGAPAPTAPKGPCCNPREQLDPRRRFLRDTTPKWWPT